MEAALDGAVLEVLAALCRRAHGTDLTLLASANLFSDLGLSSLELVDLAVGLERNLGIDEFPLQLWLDLQPTYGADGYTVGSLVAACGRLTAGLEL
jgi:acyl carrier protein